MIVGGTSDAQVMRSMRPPTFDSLDKNSSGDITLDELKAGGPNGATDSKSAARAEQIFKVMDADGSGSVSTDEKDAFDAKLQEQRQAMQFMTQLMASGSQPPRPEDIFAATDQDGSGGVTLAEFSDSEAAESLSADELSELFSTIDTDSSGEISETESSDFLDTLKEAFASAGGPGGPRGPGGPPPGPPPGANSDSDEDETDDTAIDLLTAATSAYSKQSQSDDLLSTLTRILDEAA